MTSYQNGGRNSALPDEHRGSWRPQDQPSSQSFAGRSNEDDRDYRSWRDRNYREEEDHYARDPGRWEGSRGSEVGHRDDREGYGRSTERYGQGQSGYSAGRYGEDRSQRMQNRNELISGNYEDRYQNPGVDERFSRASGSSYSADRSDRDRGYQPERYSGQGHGGSRGYEGSSSYGIGGSRDDRMGYLGYQSGSAGSQRMGYQREHNQGWSPGTSDGSGEQRPGEQRFGDTDDHSHRGTGPHRGKGPVGYQRSDERLREMICESLADDDQLDASNVEVTVKNGEVTLTGSVDDRRAKRDAEDCAATVSGVRDIQNQLRVKDDRQSGKSSFSAASASSPGAPGSNHKIETETLSQDKKHRA